jgi:hypothetical protein
VFSLITSDELGYYFDLKVYLGKEAIIKYEKPEDVKKGLNDYKYVRYLQIMA